MSSINPQQWYTAREAGAYLEITAETVKNYCRTKKMRGRQFGPKKEWHVQGSAILSKASEWGLDQLGKRS